MGGEKGGLTIHLLAVLRRRVVRLIRFIGEAGVRHMPRAPVALREERWPVSGPWRKCASGASRPQVSQPVSSRDWLQGLFDVPATRTGGTSRCQGPGGGAEHRCELGGRKWNRPCVVHGIPMARSRSAGASVATQRLTCRTVQAHLVVEDDVHRHAFEERPHTTFRLERLDERRLSQAIDDSRRNAAARHQLQPEVAGLGAVDRYEAVE